MRPELESRGLRIVTVCGDTPDRIREGRGKHGLQAVMLADPQLEATGRYNLRNERSITPSGVKATPIPAAFLVDERGVVRWIDQSEDYQVRSHPDRVLGAVKEHLG